MWETSVFICNGNDFGKRKKLWCRDGGTTKGMCLRKLEELVQRAQEETGPWQRSQMIEDKELGSKESYVLDLITYIWEFPLLLLFFRQKYQIRVRAQVWLSQRGENKVIRMGILGSAIAPLRFVVLNLNCNGFVIILCVSFPFRCRCLSV